MQEHNTILSPHPLPHHSMDIKLYKQQLRQLIGYATWQSHTHSMCLPSLPTIIGSGSQVGNTALGANSTYCCSLAITVLILGKATFFFSHALFPLLKQNHRSIYFFFLFSSFVFLSPYLFLNSFISFTHSSIHLF